MGTTDHVPLMKKGATKRNITVFLLYFILLPIVIIALPFYLLFAIGTNRNGLGDKVSESPLSAIPGVSGGGWSAGIVVFVGTFAALMVLGAVAPETETSDSETEIETTGDSDDLEQASAESDDDDDTVDDDSAPPSSDDSTPDSPENSGDSGDDIEELESVDEFEEANGEDELSEEGLVILFEAVVQGEGIDLVSVEQIGDTLYIEYHPTGATESEIAGEMGYMVGAYTEAVNQGLSTDRMDVTALDRQDMSHISYWHVETEWANQYNDGQMTIDEVSARTLGTLEPA